MPSGLYNITGILCLAMCAVASQASEDLHAVHVDRDSRASADAECLGRIIPLIMVDGNVPGLSIALIRNGRTVWHQGFGLMNSETEAPVTDDTVFEAASLGKPVFAYAVLKLAAAGRINLDTSLTTYLPEFYVDGDERLQRITARNVLSHTTGFPDWRTGPALTISFTPGEHFSYSGEGFVYLQKVVERITGLPLNDFMRDTVFEPLGMTSSSYVWEEKYESLRAFPHDSEGAVKGRRKSDQPNVAGSLQTTAVDYAKFVAAILNRTGLGQPEVQEMLRPQVRASDRCFECPGPGAGRLSQTISWGLGWGLRTDAAGDLFWHWGDNGNAMAYVVALDKEKLGLVMFANSANGLSIADEIVYQAIGLRQPQLRWLNFDAYNSAPRRLYLDILARGQAAIADYRAHREASGTRGVIAEDRMEGIGSELLRKRRIEDAVEVLKTNAEDFPDSSDAFDALGVAYLRTHDKLHAMGSFQRAVELDPNNTHAVDSLRVLRQ
jgi:CubicO group peptidase (beta-lactamase class C family)